MALRNDQEHQLTAVESVLSVFQVGEYIPESRGNEVGINPSWKISKSDFISAVRKCQQRHLPSKSHRQKMLRAFDIEMETGTGKTYTFTRTMFELNKRFGLFKFVMLVPTLAIKTNITEFLTSEETKTHFKKQFGQEINVHVVNRHEFSEIHNSSGTLPSAISNFLKAPEKDTKTVHVLLINSGMLNSPSFRKVYFLNEYGLGVKTLKEAISATKPVVIVDEPHRFGMKGKTWENLKKLKPQATLRFGATFNGQYTNLLYSLSPDEAGKQGLVKSINLIREKADSENFVKLTLNHIVEAGTELRSPKQSENPWVDIRASEIVEERYAAFTAFVDGCKYPINSYELEDCFGNLVVDEVFENGIKFENGPSILVGQSIDPFNVNEDETWEDRILRKVIHEHFELERELMSRSVRIKPFTLFFIPEIAQYRDGMHWTSGLELLGEPETLRMKFEKHLTRELKERIAVEGNRLYKDYLLRSLENVRECHGGYFAQDNQNDQCDFWRERDEILNPKGKLLSLDSTRRFIFSKWTLKEGWDNPNVFQICKFRKGGSVCSEVQELGRGLRLPVNEKGERVVDEVLYLNYFGEPDESEFKKRSDHVTAILQE